MRSEKRATRNRVYSLVGGLIVLIGAIAALRSMALLGQKKLDERYYPYPWKVLTGLAVLQSRYRIHDLDGDGVKAWAGSLGELEAAGCITPAVAAGVVHGYRYRVTRADAAGFWIEAEPDVAALGTAALHYAIDQTQVVRAAVGAPASPDADVFARRGDIEWSGPLPAGLLATEAPAPGSSGPAGPGGPER